MPTVTIVAVPTPFWCQKDGRQHGNQEGIGHGSRHFDPRDQDHKGGSFDEEAEDGRRRQCSH
ncbi:MAG TPA: hypothetical protein VGP82_07895 [Ktedonobacterales bacterium]|nr:hypothetical protein [Ktedonobacterales bacterium]